MRMDCGDIPPPSADTSRRARSRGALARQVLKGRTLDVDFVPFLTFRRLPTMLDTLFIVVTIAFFAITLAYTTGCERL